LGKLNGSQWELIGSAFSLKRIRIECERKGNRRRRRASTTLKLFHFDLANLWAGILIISQFAHGETVQLLHCSCAYILAFPSTISLPCCNCGMGSAGVNGSERSCPTPVFMRWNTRGPYGLPNTSRILMASSCNEKGFRKNGNLPSSSPCRSIASSVYP